VNIWTNDVLWFTADRLLKVGLVTGQLTETRH